MRDSILQPRRQTCLLLATGAALGGSTLLAYRWSTPAGNVSLGRAFLVVLLVMLALSRTHLRLGARSRLVLLATIPFVAAQILGLAYTQQFAIGLRHLIQFFEGFLLFWAVYAAGVTLSAHSRKAVAALPYAAFVPSGVIGLMQGIQSAMGMRPTIPFIQYTSLNDLTAQAARVGFNQGVNQFGVQRIAAAIGDPPTFGVLCAFVVIYDFWLRRKIPDAVPGIWSRVVCVVAVICLAMTASITAILVLVSGIAVSFFSTRSIGAIPRVKSRITGWSAISVTGGLVLFLLYSFVPTVTAFWSSVVTRIVSFMNGTESAIGHRELFAGAWRIFSDHPIFGVGSGAGTWVYTGVDSDFSSFHSIFALALVELGAVGLLALVFFLWFWLRIYVPPGLAIALLVAWGIYLDLNRMPYLWGLIGVVAALRQAHVQKVWGSHESVEASAIRSSDV